MPTFDSWFDEYHSTIMSIFHRSIDIDNDVPMTCFDKKQNSQWSALIYIQENIKSFSFDEWMRYVDYTIKLIIDKDSSEIEDLPYYELWQNASNPLIIALYGIFQSSDTLDDANLPDNGDH